MAIEFTIRGNPQALKRHRTVAIYRKGADGKAHPIIKNGRVITRSYDPSAEDKKDFLAAVENNIPPQLLNGPLFLEVNFYFMRPKGHFRTGLHEGELKDSSPIFHTSKPDLSNTVKFIEDALMGKYFRDDSQIAIEWISKRYADDYPFIEIKLMEIPEYIQRYGGKKEITVNQTVLEI